MAHYTLITSCPDQVGIVAKVSQFIADHKGSIIEADYHTDHETKWFYMRQVIDEASISFSNKFDFEKAFATCAANFNMQWELHLSSNKNRLAILCSKQDHCLSDLLYRLRTGELDCEVPCVISNHMVNRDFVEWHGIPFHHVPISKNNKVEAFAEIERLLESYRTDSIVLARFMQIMPEELCEKYSGRMINIHHSFLPSFIGDRPYHKAYERGVKLVGATCHYVTKDLDEGPIIEQDVIRVNHSHSVDDMIRLGRDVEVRVLAHGVRYHLENRVIVQKNKTVVFK